MTEGKFIYVPGPTLDVYFGSKTCDNRKNAIVGAGAVVTKNIPGEVWAGNPAHFIRKIEN